MSLTLVKLLSLLGGVPLWLSSWVCGLIHWRLGSRGCSWWLHHLAPLARGWSQCCAVPEPGRPSWGGSADQLPGSQGLKVLLLGLATEWMLGPWGLLCRDPLGEGEPSLYGGGEGGHSPSLCSCLGRLVGCSVGGIPERSRVSHAPIEGMWGQESSVQRVCRSLLRPVEKHMVNLWLCWFLPFGAKKKKKKNLLFLLVMAGASELRLWVPEFGWGVGDALPPCHSRGTAVSPSSVIMVLGPGFSALPPCSCVFWPQCW